MLTSKGRHAIMTYYTSMEEHPIDILNLPSLEERVKANMERGAFGYIRGGIRG